VPDGVAGPINVNIADLPTGNIQPEFFAILDTFRNTLSREFEAGCRPIIALFLSVAVKQARSQFGASRLAIHSEFPIPPVLIPEIGLVGGKLDFMTADVVGRGPMGKHSFIWHFSPLPSRFCDENSRRYRCFTQCSDIYSS